MIVLIWGEEGVWKSTMALTWPKPLRHFETDIGGFKRASWRFAAEKNGIISSPYPLPMQIDKMMGNTATKDAGGKVLSIRQSKKIVGLSELWQKFVGDFVKAIESTEPEFKTLVIDSGTMLWTVNHRSYLQQLQEKQMSKPDYKGEQELRDNLISIEYAAVNERMTQLFNAANSYGKNLVLTHYPKEVYESIYRVDHYESVATGKYDIDGFKESRRLADLIVKLQWVTVKNERKVVGKIEKCGLPGLGSMAVGMEIEPSYQALEQLAEAMGAAL
jgi:hypothetical protein